MSNFTKFSIVIILLFLSFFTGELVGIRTTLKHTQNADTVIVLDTTFECKYDTVIVSKPVPIYNEKITTIRDTFTTIKNDTVVVEVPLEKKIYSDSLYYAVVSGYKANLDTIKTFNKETVITVNKVSYKQKKWGISAFAGPAYGILNNKADIAVGIGLTYTIK